MSRPSFSPEFHQRRDDWASDYLPNGKAENWALDRAVAASLRIERCERALEQVVDAHSQHARMTWNEDQHLAAATLISRLANNPTLYSARLQTTLHGVELMIEYWYRLLETLVEGSDWSEAQASTALDLLGIPTTLRDGRTPIDDPEAEAEAEDEDGPATSFRKTLASGEIQRLVALRDEALQSIDDLERKQAIRGDVALLAGPAKLIQRYERDAWRRFNQSIKVLSRPTPSPEARPIVKPVAPAARPTPPPPPPSPSPSMPAPAFVISQADQDMITDARARMIREMGLQGYDAEFDFDRDFDLELDRLEASLPVDRTKPILVNPSVVQPQ